MKAVTVKEMDPDMSEVSRPNITIASANQLLSLPLPLPLDSINRGVGLDPSDHRSFANLSPPIGVAELYFSDRIQGRSRQSSRARPRADVIHSNTQSRVQSRESGKRAGSLKERTPRRKGFNLGPMVDFKDLSMSLMMTKDQSWKEARLSSE